MDAFSRSLAAAALVDGQHFTLPGFGTIEGVYISARIDHGARRVEAPRLEVRWQSEEDSTAQTFADLLISTGATRFEAEDIQGHWLDALTTGKSIQIGDLGTLAPESNGGNCTFQPNTAALKSAYSGSLTVPLEPISKRELPESPVAPVVEIEKATQQVASAKTKSSFVRYLVPVASAAAMVLLGVIAINFFSKSSNIEENHGKAVTVNQDRLNRSPREEVTTADLPIERLEEDTPSDLIAGEPAVFEKNVDSKGIAEDLTVEDNAISSTEYTTKEVETIVADHSAAIPQQEIPSFDPAALAGALHDDNLFELSEIDVVIVLGSFSNSANAARLTEKVAEAGLIPYVDQPGSFTRVGATFSVTTEAEIEELKLRMQQQFNPSAWVLE